MSGLLYIQNLKDQMGDQIELEGCGQKLGRESGKRRSEVVKL